MKPQEFDDLLRQTLQDEQLSRGEKDLLKRILSDGRIDESRLAHYRHQAFAMARQAVTTGDAQRVLDWLEEVVKVLLRSQSIVTTSVAEAYFSPEDDCAKQITKLISAVETKVDICVFTITDNRITHAIEYAHGRGKAIRIITDDQKRHDAGSDIAHLVRAGIPIHIDRSEYHMHHKFAIFDDEKLLTGSYNWTRGAAENNEENFLVTDDPRLVRRYADKFDSLWGRTQPLRQSG